MLATASIWEVSLGVQRVVRRGGMVPYIRALLCLNLLQGTLVIQTILDNGRMRFPDLAAQLPLVDRTGIPSHSMPELCLTRNTVCHKTMKTLIQSRFLKSTTEYMNKSRVNA